MGPVYRLTGQLSGADAKFFAGFMAKNFVAGASHHSTDGTGGGGYVCPPRKVHSGETGRRGGGRREDCCAIRRSFHTPSGVQGSAGHGATEAARPERSLQARFFTHRTVATARNRASGFGGDWRVRKQLPVVVGLTTGCRRAAGSRSGRNKRQPETVTVSRNIAPVRHTAIHYLLTGKPGRQRRRRCTCISGRRQPAGVFARADRRPPPPALYHLFLLP